MINATLNLIHKLLVYRDFITIRVKYFGTCCVNYTEPNKSSKFNVVPNAYVAPGPRPINYNVTKSFLC